MNKEIVLTALAVWVLLSFMPALLLTSLMGRGRAAGAAK